MHLLPPQRIDRDRTRAIDDDGIEVDARDVGALDAGLAEGLVDEAFWVQRRPAWTTTG